MWWRIICSLVILVYFYNSHADYRTETARYNKALTGQIYLIPPPEDAVGIWVKKTDIYEARQQLVRAEYPELFQKIEAVMIENPGTYSDVYFVDIPGKESFSTFFFDESQLNQIKDKDFITFLQINQLAADLQKYYPGGYPAGSNPTAPEIRNKLAKTLEVFKFKAILSGVILFLIWLSYFLIQRHNRNELNRI